MIFFPFVIILIKLSSNLTSEINFDIKTASALQVCPCSKFQDDWLPSSSNPIGQKLLYLLIKIIAGLI